MSSSQIETITSEPVIVPSPNDPTIINANEPTTPETIEGRLSRLEQSLLSKIFPQPRPRSPSPTRRPRSRSRSRSIIIHERPRYHSPPPMENPPIFTNSTSLLTHLQTHPTQPDTLAEIQSSPGPGRCTTHMIHLTTLPTHQAELDKIAWVFTAGVEDSWLQNPGGRETLRFDLPGGNGGGRRRPVVDYYEDRYDDRFEDRFQRGVTPLVKLGRVFSKKDGNENEDGSENKEDEEEKEWKYLTIIQGKGNSGWVKLSVSYSAQGALVDIFHEVVNGYSVLFVGKVLVGVDLARVWKMAGGEGEVVFKKVGSLEEAKSVGNGLVGVVC